MKMSLHLISKVLSSVAAESLRSSMRSCFTMTGLQFQCASEPTVSGTSIYLTARQGVEASRSLTLLLGSPVMAMNV